MTSITDSDDAITDAMSMAGWRAALETNAEAIICLTSTGFTVRSIARFRPEARILAFSPDERTVRQLSMSWGARAFPIEALPIDADDQPGARAGPHPGRGPQRRPGRRAVRLARVPGQGHRHVAPDARAVTEAARSSAGIVDEVIDGLAVYRHQRRRRRRRTAAAPVVMLHGSMDRAASFLKVTRRLPELDIVRYDRRGYGRSVGAGLCLLDRRAGRRPARGDGPSSRRSWSATASAGSSPWPPPSAGPISCRRSAPSSRRWPGSTGGRRPRPAAPPCRPAATAAPRTRPSGSCGAWSATSVWERLPERTRRERRSEGPALLAELATIRGDAALRAGAR